MVVVLGVGSVGKAEEWKSEVDLWGRERVRRWSSKGGRENNKSQILRMANLVIINISLSSSYQCSECFRPIVSDDKPIVHNSAPVVRSSFDGGMAPPLRIV